jgi:XTP/dITP diphosphohydrolase
VRLALATSNPGKVREFAALAKAHGLAVEFLGAPMSGEEPGATFEENARWKAAAAARATGLAAVGDDSGLRVDALSGAPGIRSARYSGEGEAGNRRKLLAALAGVPPERRGAHFACALALARPDGRVEVFHGECHGRIALAPRGAGGFGYDPLFELPDGRTMAELPEAEKNALSHRGRAFAQLAARLRTAAAE